MKVLRYDTSSESSLEPHATVSPDALSQRIVYVFQDQYPWDIRVDKITSSLVDAGCDVVIVSRNRTGLPTQATLRSGLTIRRLPGKCPGLLRTLINFPAFFSPVWIWAIWHTARTRRAGLIIIRDLPLAPAAWLAGKLLKVPVIMDMAENYPAMIQDTWDHRGPARFDFLLRNPNLLRRLEKWILPRMNGVMTVSQASRSRVLQLVEREKVPVWTVRNTPRLEAHADPADSALAQRLRECSDLKLLYVGGLEESRGLATVIEAMPLVRERIGETTLVIVGEGPNRPALEQQADRLGVREHVIFAGWLDQAYVPSVIAAVDICLVPHLVTEHIETTIPNKIYDYMAQARPVLVTQSTSLREIVEGCGCGLWYRDSDSGSLADAVARLSDSDLRLEMGRRGKTAIEEEQNWAVDERTIIGIVRQTSLPR